MTLIQINNFFDIDQNLRVSMKFIIPLIIFLGGQLMAQNDTLNKFNNHRKKQGYWIEYLDKNLNPTDSAKARYKSYGLYENGKQLIGPYKQRTKKNKLLVTNTDTLQGCFFVNGTFKWINPKTSDVHIEENYSNGFVTITKQYEYKNRLTGRVLSFLYVLDFTKQYDNTPGSFFSEEWFNPDVYSKGGVRKSWKTKIGNKWKWIEAK